MTKRTLLSVPALLVATLAACDRTPTLEVRTFPVEHMAPHQIHPLIEPYVFADREGAPGTASSTDGALTVRETRDNLDKIARVLAQYDTPRPDVRLHFQLIEADGFTDSDPRIAAVEAELRRVFQFDGYRLAGEAFVSATDRSEVMQALRASDGLYEIGGRVYTLQGGLVRLEEIRMQSTGGIFLTTTVNIRRGQTIVLGSSPKDLGRGSATATLLLTVRAESSGAPGAGADSVSR